MKFYPKVVMRHLDLSVFFKSLLVTRGDRGWVHAITHPCSCLMQNAAAQYSLPDLPADLLSHAYMLTTLEMLQNYLVITTERLPFSH